MGMFGRGAAAAENADPSQLSGSDRLMMIGAMLRDSGNALRGTDSDALAQMQKLMIARQEQAAKDGFQKRLEGMIGPQFQNAPDIAVGMPSQVAGTGTPDAVNLGAGSSGFMSQDTRPPPMPDNLPETFLPRKTSDGLNINSPELPALALQAKAAGVDISSLLDVMKAQQPDVRYDRGYGYNGKTGASAGGYHPDLDKGQEPLYDSSGRIVGVRNVNGAVQSASEMAGAVSNAQEGAKAGYDLVAVPQADGSTRMMPRSQAVGMLGGGGMPASGGQGGGGFGVSQTPGGRAAAEAVGRKEGEAGAQARIDFPAIVQRSNQSLALIDGLISDKHLKDAVGWNSKIPAWPGSPRVGVEAKLDQLGGTVFLQAYNELKGAGAITEIEGAKAESAIARLNRRDQSYEDYLQALTDLREVIAGGVGRAQQRAQGGVESRGGGVSSAPPSAITYLRTHPNLAAAFDAKYGRGAARSALGQ